MLRGPRRVLRLPHVPLGHDQHAQAQARIPVQLVLRALKRRSLVLGAQAEPGEDGGVGALAVKDLKRREGSGIRGSNVQGSND